MNLRKIIKEQVGKLFESFSAFKGAEILSKFPCVELPETRAQVDWSNRDVPGWGAVYFPALDGNGLSQMFGKDDVLAYIEGFIKKFGEEPQFILNPTGQWFDKIKVTNPSYLKAKDLMDKAIQDFGTEGD